MGLAGYGGAVYAHSNPVLAVQVSALFYPCLSAIPHIYHQIKSQSGGVDRGHSLNNGLAVVDVITILACRMLDLIGNQGILILGSIAATRFFLFKIFKISQGISSNDVEVLIVIESIAILACRILGLMGNQAALLLSMIVITRFLQRDVEKAWMSTYTSVRNITIMGFAGYGLAILENSNPTLAVKAAVIYQFAFHLIKLLIDRFVIVPYNFLHIRDYYKIIGECALNAIAIMTFRILGLISNRGVMILGTLAIAKFIISYPKLVRPISNINEPTWNL